MHFDALSRGPCELGQTRGRWNNALGEHRKKGNVTNVSNASISRPFPEIYSESSGIVTERRVSCRPRWRVSASRDLVLK